MKTDCCCQPFINIGVCGCCEGVEAFTPSPKANRPGLPALSYRIGTHAAFLETMKARLSSSKYQKLAELTTRESCDPSVAMLDAWATVADVLTFYQERIANEGYLRTATERRSILEMARLIGYKPRPGVASNVYLAYTVDNNFKEETVVPKGAKSQSIPGPGEMPQTFETSEELKVRTDWNNLKPRTSKPQEIPFDQALRVTKIYLEGTTTNLKPNDPLLLVYGEKSGEKILRRIEAVNADFENARTEVVLQAVPVLICLVVEAMRVMNANLSKESPVKGNINNLIGARILLGIILDNLSLGKYPPLHEAYFSHEHIYQFLKNFFLKKFLSSNIKREFSIKISEYLALLEQSQVTTKTKQIKIFISLFFDAFADSILKFNQDIICLLRHILQQIQPSEFDPIELKVFTNFVPIFIRYIGIYFYYWKKYYSNEFDKILNALAELFRDPGLKKDLIKLIDKFKNQLSLNKSERVNILLQGISDWLKKIPVNEEGVHCGVTILKTTNFNDLVSLCSPLIKPPSIQVANNLRLTRDIGILLSAKSRAMPEMLINFQPRLKPVLYQALANATVVASKVNQPTNFRINLTNAKDSTTSENSKTSGLLSIHALRLSAALFGNNASKIMGFKENPDSITKKEIKFITVPDGDWDPQDNGEEGKARVFLDNAYDEVKQGAHIIINNHFLKTVTVATADSVAIRPRTAYGISGKTTQIELSRDWWQAQTMESIRKTMVYVETVKLSLAMMPDTDPVSGQSVDLQTLHGGLPTGRWVIVSGELANVPGDTPGVKMSELAMLTDVEHDIDEKLTGGDKTRTRITFDKTLVNTFKRNTVTVYGNVVKATHGESRKEVLGSADGAKGLQSFALKQPPLTFVSAANPSGVDSTLSVYVNDIKWQETDALAGLSFTDRNFITKTDDDGKTTIIFGNGREGARLPTGIENIKAEYRNSIGKPGNVKAEQITLLTTRPLGVKEVINPLKASGGADKESRDQARKNAPLAVMALDRLVSVQDYEDFCRIYAGVGKASAVVISDGCRQLVHITFAGVDDIPLEKDSDLYRNLYRSLLDFGDPYQPIQLEFRELMYIVVSADIRIKPEYLWEPVVTQVRNALLDTFSFDRMELGQDVLLSELLCTIQNVRGVEYVDLDTFGGIPEKRLDEITDMRRLLTPEEISKKVNYLVEAIQLEPRLRVNLAGYKDKDENIEKDSQGNPVLHPAQIAFITPEVPETLILNQII